MASRYGAVTREALNQFRLEEVGELMEMDFQDNLNKVAMIDTLLEIPRRSFAYQCSLKQSEGGAISRRSKRIRERLFLNPYTPTESKQSGEVTPEMREAVSKRFGVTFLPKGEPHAN